LAIRNIGGNEGERFHAGRLNPVHVKSVAVRVGDAESACDGSIFRYVGADDFYVRARSEGLNMPVEASGL
jgi:hypothetical protein